MCISDAMHFVAGSVFPVPLCPECWHYTPWISKSVYEECPPGGGGSWCGEALWQLPICPAGLASVKSAAGIQPAISYGESSYRVRIFPKPVLIALFAARFKGWAFPHGSKMAAEVPYNMHITSRIVQNRIIQLEDRLRKWIIPAFFGLFATQPCLAHAGLTSGVRPGSWMATSLS